MRSADTVRCLQPSQPPLLLQGPQEDPLFLPICSKDARVSVALRPQWSLTPLVRKFPPLLLPTPRPS